MKTLHVSTSIRATTDAHGEILAGASEYTTWSKPIDQVEGRITLGEKATVHAKLSPGRFAVCLKKWAEAASQGA